MSERVPPHSSAPITSQCQGGFAAFAGNANGPSRASDATCKVTYDSSNDSRCANLTLARRICTICRSGLAKVSLPYPEWKHNLSVKEGILLTIYFLILTGPTQSVPLHAPTYGTNPWQGQSMDYDGIRPYTTSYGDMSSFGGGSSSVPNEFRASQTDDAPQVTQPTQPEDGDLQGNDNDPRRSNRERHEPNRLSLSDPRHAAGGRKKLQKSKLTHLRL
uniref:Uncharacterized protein n=1 Tax=Oryza punctata TaxID=4537 RepID=A0A0E0JLE8_ORYPU